MIDPKLLPLLILAFAAVLLAGARSARAALADRRERRALAEQAEYLRMTGWIKKIRPEDAGPAITRDKQGRVNVFLGLRRYVPTGKYRRGERVR